MTDTPALSDCCWFDHPVNTSRPWLIAGKGPSFATRTELPVGRFSVMTLNDAANHIRCNVAHVIDLDAFDRLTPGTLSRVSAVVMPWRPHVDNRPDKPLAELIGSNSPLAAVHAAGKLRWYNCGLGGRSVDPVSTRGPVVGVRYFSSEAAANLLLARGVPRLYTIGIDGGDQYASDFDGLSPLTNGRDSFDKGVSELARICDKHGAPLVNLATDKVTPLTDYISAGKNRHWQDWRVIEPGPFSGRNTIRLARLFQNVTAYEPRRVNVRTCRQLAGDIGTTNVAIMSGAFNPATSVHAELIFHSGVLYHLADPVEHLMQLPRVAPRLYLNTHVDRPNQPASRKTTTAGGSGWTFTEHINRPRAGLQPQSIWLEYQTLITTLVAAGYDRESISLLSDVQESSGRRIALMASV